jgi:hypothetical protein
MVEPWKYFFFDSCHIIEVYSCHSSHVCVNQVEFFIHNEIVSKSSQQFDDDILHHSAKLPIFITSICLLFETPPNETCIAYFIIFDCLRDDDANYEVWTTVLPTAPLQIAQNHLLFTSNWNFSCWIDESAMTTFCTTSL